MKTLTKTTTHVSRAKEYNNSIMQQVCDLLNWTPDQYCNHQYACYEDTLHRLFYETPVVLEQLRLSPVFRGLFINEWNDRTKCDLLDQAMVQDSGTLLAPDGSFVFQELDSSNDEQEYLFIHSAHRLANDPEFLTAINQVMDLVFKSSKW